MSLLLTILGISIGGLVVYAVIRYYETTGTVADRLAAAWSGSLTIFVGVWGGLLSLFGVGFDWIAQLTGDSQFTQLADAIKGVIPPTYQPVIPVATIGLMMIARTRTLGK